MDLSDCIDQSTEDTTIVATQKGYSVDLDAKLSTFRKQFRDAIIKVVDQYFNYKLPKDVAKAILDFLEWNFIDKSFVLAAHKTIEDGTDVQGMVVDAISSEIESKRQVDSFYIAGGVLKGLNFKCNHSCSRKYSRLSTCRDCLECILSYESCQYGSFETRTVKQNFCVRDLEVEIEKLLGGIVKVALDFNAPDNDSSIHCYTSYRRIEDKRHRKKRSQNPDGPHFEKGDIVWAPYEGRDAEARITKVDGKEVQIEWVGYEDDPKEWKYIGDITLKRLSKRKPRKFDNGPTFSKGDIVVAKVNGQDWLGSVVYWLPDHSKYKVEWLEYSGTYFCKSRDMRKWMSEDPQPNRRPRRSPVRRERFSSSRRERF